MGNDYLTPVLEGQCVLDLVQNNATLSGNESAIPNRLENYIMQPTEKSTILEGEEEDSILLNVQMEFSKKL